MTFKTGDFVSVDFDIYANGKLVQTTNEKLGKENGLNIEAYGPQTIILGKAMVLKALDEAIEKKDKGTLELSADDAYGKRKKELLKVFPKSAFDEQKMRIVPGMTYDFNGMYGTVRSLVGGRVTVDFNNPLAGKSIKIDYSNAKAVEKIEDKVKFVLTNAMRLPENMFEVKATAKKVTLSVPAQLVAMKEMLEKSFGEMIIDFKDYTLEVKEMGDKKEKKAPAKKSTAKADDKKSE